MREAIKIISILGIAFLIYLPSLNAPFILDDADKIVNNPDIKDLNELPGKLIYPYSENRTWKRNDPSRPFVYLSLIHI